MITSSNNVLHSFFWKFLERMGAQLVSFVVSLFLARLLSPSDYGLVAIVIVFTNLATVFVQSGFNVAIIQKQNPERLDYSSVLLFSFFVATIIYFLLFFFSSSIANFYNNKDLILVIKILSLILFPSAFNSVQISYISKESLFKKLCFANLFAAIISGFIGIVLALKNGGVWALVFQQLIYQTLCVLFIFIATKWFPGFELSLKNLKKLANFGLKIFATNFMTAVFLNIRDLIIGKSFSSVSLAFFKQGKLFPNTIISSIDLSIQSVLLPAYSERQENYESIKTVLLKSISLSSYLIFPMMAGMCTVSELMISVVLTDKWLPCVPYLRIYCLIFALKPLHTANIQSLIGIGKSDIIFKLDVIRKTIEVLSIVIGFFWGVKGIALGALCSSIISIFINLYPNRKILNLGYFAQLRILIHPFCGSVLMSICILFFNNFFVFSNLLLLIFDILIGIVVYILYSIIFKVVPFKYIKTLFFTVVNQKK